MISENRQKYVFGKDSHSMRASIDMWLYQCFEEYERLKHGRWNVFNEKDEGFYCCKLVWSYDGWYTPKSVRIGIYHKTNKDLILCIFDEQINNPNPLTDEILIEKLKIWEDKYKDKY